MSIRGRNGILGNNRRRRRRGSSAGIIAPARASSKSDNNGDCKSGRLPGNFRDIYEVHLASVPKGRPRSQRRPHRAGRRPGGEPTGTPDPEPTPATRQTGLLRGIPGKKKQTIRTPRSLFDCDSRCCGTPVEKVQGAMPQRSATTLRAAPVGSWQHRRCPAAVPVG